MGTIRKPLRLTDLAQCCVCGKAIDTREIADGGGPDGAQLSDQRWVCTIECYEVVVPE